MRERREELRLTRAALAVEAGCSLTHLENIEAGLVPRRGHVLDRVFAVLALNDDEGPGSPPSVNLPDQPGRDEDSDALS